MSKVEDRIRELGYELPACPTPVGAYVPAQPADNGLLFVSGQTPIQDGKVVYVGKVGDTVTVEDGYKAARICMLRLLAQVKYILGDLDRVEKIIKVNGYVNCAPDFGQQPQVINGASELLEQIFGQGGKHARAAVGVASLPDQSAVEVEMIIQYKQ